MLDHNVEMGQTRTGNKAVMWRALAVALGLHVIILLIPIARQLSPADMDHAVIELSLSANHRQPAEPPSQIQAPEAQELPKPAPVEEKQPQEQLEVPVEPPVLQQKPSQGRVADAHEEKGRKPDAETPLLTSAILSRQFITEESITDSLFPDTISRPVSGLQAEFHYPVRQNMITLLNQPMPDLPFEYQAGLVHFAYDPGVKGDLQRFWDVITPEFGWRTKYGTEVRCIWVLIIGGCAWK